MVTKWSLSRYILPTFQIHLLYTWNSSVKPNVVCVPVHFFFTAAHFHPCGRHNFHFLTVALKLSCFYSKEIDLRYFFLFLALSRVIHVNVDIKFSGKKCSVLLLENSCTAVAFDWTCNFSHTWEKHCSLLWWLDELMNLRMKINDISF